MPPKLLTVCRRLLPAPPSMLPRGMYTHRADTRFATSLTSATTIHSSDRQPATAAQGQHARQRTSRNAMDLPWNSKGRPIPATLLAVWLYVPSPAVLSESPFPTWLPSTRPSPRAVASNAGSLFRSLMLMLSAARWPVRKETPECGLVSLCDG